MLTNCAFAIPQCFYDMTSAELPDDQLEYAKKVLEEKDLDISEDLSAEVADALIAVVGVDAFKTTIDVLRQVVHLPKLLNRVNGIGRAVDGSIT